MLDHYETAKAYLPDNHEIRKLITKVRHHTSLVHAILTVPHLSPASHRQALHQVHAQSEGAVAVAEGDPQPCTPYTERYWGLGNHRAYHTWHNVASCVQRRTSRRRRSLASMNALWPAAATTGVSMWDRCSGNLLLRVPANRDILNCVQVWRCILCVWLTCRRAIRQR